MLNIAVLHPSISGNDDQTDVPKYKLNLEEYVADKVVYVRLQEKKKFSKRDKEWKKAAEVLNNICLLFHLLFVIATFGATFIKGYSLT